MKDTNKLNPEIRFSGFTDDWEQRKFEKFAQRQSNTMISNPDNPCIEYEDVISEQGILNKDVCSKDAEKNGIIFTEEDILYGKLRPYLHNWLNPDFKGVAVGDWWVLRPINMDKNFLYWLIQTPQYDNAANQSSGTKMPRADWKLVSNTDFYVPISNEEQAKIAGLFEKINTLITLHQRKLNGLKNVKKAMLEKMFPKNGESIPEIRFSGFTDDWEQRKYSDIATTRRGLTYKPSDTTDSGKRVLRSSNINEDNFEIHNDDVFVDEGAVNIPYVKNGDILITSANGSSRLVGKHAIIHDIPDNCVVHGGFMLIASSDEPEFVNTLMSSQWYTKFINVYVAGGNGAIGNLNKNYLDEQIVLVPSKKERKKIGNYFSNLDRLITLHQRKLDKLKTLKKAMLEKMFI